MKTGALQADFDVPRYFERAPAWLRESVALDAESLARNSTASRSVVLPTRNVVLGNAATDMKWLYIGAASSIRHPSPDSVAASCSGFLH